MGTLWNTYAFYILYANIDKFDPTKYKLEYDKLSVMDKWVISRLNTLIATVDKNLEEYRITESARAIQEFVDDLSNWYVRRSRERFWQKDMNQDKINAYMTLYTALIELVKTAAPFVPFIAEEIYGNLVRSVDKNAHESVHLCDYPVANPKYVDADLENYMDHVLKLVVLGRACRNTANIKNRQPIGKMYINVKGHTSARSGELGSEVCPSLNDNATLPVMYTDIIRDELNVKEVVFTDDARKFTVYKFKPQLKTLGPRYGKLVPQIGKVLAEVDGNDVMERFGKGEKLSFELDGTLIELAETDVLIETVRKEGFVSESDRDITVVLDTNLTPELIEEGFVREIISKIQTMRKEADFEVQDHIKVFYGSNAKIAGIMERNKALVSDEVLAHEIMPGSGEGYEKEWNINGEAAVFVVSKV